MMVDTSHVCLRICRLPSTSSLPRRLAHTGHINGLPSPLAFQVSSALEESQEFGGMEQTEVGVFIPTTSSLKDCLLLASFQNSGHLPVALYPILSF